jgi:hypothetical protein
MNKHDENLLGTLIAMTTMIFLVVAMILCAHFMR